MIMGFAYEFIYQDWEYIIRTMNTKQIQCRLYTIIGLADRDGLFIKNVRWNSPFEGMTCLMNVTFGACMCYFTSSGCTFTQLMSSGQPGML